MSKTVRKEIPFEWVLAELDRVSPTTKPMFGAYGVYVEDKIVFILRDKQQAQSDNGIWLATTPEHHSSLKKDFPMMKSIEVFGPGVTGWQVLPSSSEDFEESALKACRFVVAGDPRIGKIPKNKKLKTKLAKTQKAKRKKKV